MRYEEFISQVQIRAGLNREQAQRAIAASLQVLGECSSNPGDSPVVASSLPAELRIYVLRADRTERYSLVSFYQRIASLTGIGYPEAMTETKAVMSVLEHAVTPGELEQIKRELPQGVREEFFGPKVRRAS